MPRFETTDQVDQVMQGDQLQALWDEVTRLRGRLRRIRELCGGLGANTDGRVVGQIRSLADIDA